MEDMNNNKGEQTIPTENTDNKGNPKTFQPKDGKDNKGNSKTFQPKDGKGKQGHGKGKSKGNGEKKNKGFNHPEWYITTPEMAKDVASFPFGYRVGQVYTQGRADLNTRSSLVIPGIQVIRYSPAYGVGDFASQSPIDIAKRILNTTVRSSNSRTASYDSDDLMVSHLAALNCYHLVTYMRRFFAITKLFSYKNAFLPKAIITAIGLDYEDFIANAANYRAEFNMQLILLASLKVPAGMTLLDRWTYLAGNIFTDTDSLKTQFTIYAPNSIHKWSATGKDTGSALQLVDVPHSKTTKFSSLIELLNECIVALLDDADVHNMQNDIAKAFESAPMLAPLGVLENYEINLIPDPNIKAQLRSATITPGRINWLYQETAGGKFAVETEITLSHGQPGAGANLTYATQGIPILMDHKVVTPEETITALVDVAMYSMTADFSTSESELNFDLLSSGPELINSVEYYSTPMNTDGTYDPSSRAVVRTTNHSEYVEQEGANRYTSGYAIGVSNAYSFTPYIRYVALGDMYDAEPSDIIVGYLENAIILNQNDIIATHDAMWYKLLSITTPKFGNIEKIDKNKVSNKNNSK